MKIQIKYPLVFALLCFWVGVLLSISFLETPLKFFVPGITLPVALELGKMMFGVSTYIQLALMLIITLNFLISRTKISVKMLLVFALISAILLLEKLWMLPVLDARADILSAGKGVPPTPLHNIFIYAESAKGILILIAIFQQIKLKNN